MTEFAYYQSGLDWGRFTSAPTGVSVRWYDEDNFTPLTSTRNADVAAVSHIDVAVTLSRWQAGEFDGHAHDTCFTTTRGDKYERKNAHHWVNREQNFALDLIEADGAIVGFQVTGRNITSVLVQPAFAGLSAVGAWIAAGYTNRVFTPGRTLDVRVPLRDGVELAATVLLPAGISPVATIMERTPYGREVYVPQYQRYVQRGYAVVLEDVRGRGDSAGEWVPMVHEQDDGDDTLDWIAAQPWSNGRVGMSGGSYGGYVQWAAAASGNPHLQAIVSLVTAGGPFTDTYYRTGAPFMAQAAWSFATDTRHFNKDLTDRTDWDQLMQVRPLWKMPVVGLGHEIPGFTAFMQHNRYDDFIERGDWYARRDQITVPAFIQSGWYDDDGIGTTEAIAATNDYPVGNRRMLLGPWLHGGNAQYDLGPTHLGTEAIRADVDLLHQQWFDHFLKGVQNTVNAGAIVEYFTVGENKWHVTDQFPPRGIEQTFYFDAAHSMGVEQPTPTSTVSYDHDPHNPVPKLISVTQNEFEFPADYSAVEQRPDVVSFTTPVLTQPLRIAGQVAATLYASTSAYDCDWDVRVLDVTPDGQSIQIVEGCMNAKFRDSLTAPEFLEPGQVYPFTILTQKTSYELAPGHRLRVDVQSSAAGFIFPNGGTKAGFETAATVIAHQTIYAGGQTPSRITFVQDSSVE